MRTINISEETYEAIKDQLEDKEEEEKEYKQLLEAVFAGLKYSERKVYEVQLERDKVIS